MRLLLLPLLLAALGNADIVKLVKAGLSAETIEAKIAASEVDFDTSTDVLVALAKDGVPERVIRAMIGRDGAIAPPVRPAPPTAPRALSRRYDVTLHADGGGGGKCEGELRVDGRGSRRRAAAHSTSRWLGRTSAASATPTGFVESS